MINDQFIARLGSCADIQQPTFPFLGFSVSFSQFLETLQIVLKCEICHVPLRILRRKVNTRNFTPLIFYIFPAGYTRRAFIKLKNLGNIGCEN